MQRMFLFYLFLCLSVCIFPIGNFGQETNEGNHCPIVLVHGFGGWGPDELLGYKYWGGTALDIPAYLTENGFNVLVSSVGPISSNHDRACELFYQIKGGQTDYGMAHAKAYGHNRYSKSWPGFYPKWDKNNPIHLIGHSMGGQTCRVLVELLAKDYFGMGTDETWVKSVTTISTPNKGTTLATMVNTLSNGFAEEIVCGFLGLAGTDWKVYNFDMEQWNLVPKPDETIQDFFKRIESAIGNTEDISIYDLLPKGAEALNKKVRTYSKVYYFSYATEETYVLRTPPDYEWGEPAMNPMFWAYAYYMGHYDGTEVSPNNEWWQNDGIVNTVSMKGPSNATIVPYTGVPKPGVWNYMGLTESKDHGKIIGHYQDPLLTGKWLKKFYLDMASMLYKIK